MGLIRFIILKIGSSGKKYAKNTGFVIKQPKTYN